MRPCQPRWIKYLFITVAILVGLSACGQKGDLYHREDKQSSIESVPVDA
jgi:predicted small lipoprotein YifL